MWGLLFTPGRLRLTSVRHTYTRTILVTIIIMCVVYTFTHARASLTCSHACILAHFFCSSSAPPSTPGGRSSQRSSSPPPFSDADADMDDDDREEADRILNP